MSDHPTTLTEAEQERLDGSLADSGCLGFLGDHPDLYAVAERIKADAYAAGLAARTPTATGGAESCPFCHGDPDALADAHGEGWRAGREVGRREAATGGDLRDRVTADASWALWTPSVWGSPDERSVPLLLAAIGQALTASPAPVVSEEADRFYVGVGIDQRRCAACVTAPTLPCADHRDHEPCTGAADCPARLHEHGCYADRDGTACNDPDDHAPAPVVSRPEAADVMVPLTAADASDLQRWLAKALDGGVSLHQEAASGGRRILAAVARAASLATDPEAGGDS